MNRNLVNIQVQWLKFSCITTLRCTSALKSLSAVEQDAFLLLLLMLSGCEKPSMIITGLKTENMTDPINVDVPVSGT